MKPHYKNYSSPISTIAFYALFSVHNQEGKLCSQTRSQELQAEKNVFFIVFILMFDLAEISLGSFSALNTLSRCPVLYDWFDCIQFSNMYD